MAASPDGSLLAAASADDIVRGGDGELIPLDLGAQPRVVGDSVDIGAFEVQ